MGRPVVRPMGLPMALPTGQPMGGPVGHPMGHPMDHPIGCPTGCLVCSSYVWWVGIGGAGWRVSGFLDASVGTWASWSHSTTNTTHKEHSWWYTYSRRSGMLRTYYTRTNSYLVGATVAAAAPTYPHIILTDTYLLCTYKVLLVQYGFCRNSTSRIDGFKIIQDP